MKIKQIFYLILFLGAVSNITLLILHLINDKDNYNNCNSYKKNCNCEGNKKNCGCEYNKENYKIKKCQQKVKKNIN